MNIRNQQTLQVSACGVFFLLRANRLSITNIFAHIKKYGYTKEYAEANSFEFKFCSGPNSLIPESIIKPVVTEPATTKPAEVSTTTNPDNTTDRQV